MMGQANPRQSTSRFVLRSVNGGYKIERLTWDNDLNGWFHAGWLNGGRKFSDRQAAREYMLEEGS